MFQATSTSLTKMVQVPMFSLMFTVVVFFTSEEFVTWLHPNAYNNAERSMEVGIDIGKSFPGCSTVFVDISSMYGGVSRAWLEMHSSQTSVYTKLFSKELWKYQTNGHNCVLAFEQREWYHPYQRQMSKHMNKLGHTYKYVAFPIKLRSHYVSSSNSSTVVFLEDVIHSIANESQANVIVHIPISSQTPLLRQSEIHSALCIPTAYIYTHQDPSAYTYTPLKTVWRQPNCNTTVYNVREPVIYPILANVVQ